MTKAPDAPSQAEDTALGAEKRALRGAMRTATRAIRPFSRSFRSSRLAARLLRSPPLAQRGLVLAYRALPDEVCVDGLVEALLARGWRVAFPRVDAGGAMTLVEVGGAPGGDAGASLLRDPSRWDVDRHGIASPRLDAAGARRVHPREIDAVIVPGRAFDGAGNRLGRGGGHYDRLLARLRPDARSRTVGVAFREQVVPRVPVGANDRAVAWLATDARTARAARFRAENGRNATEAK
ncbi:MAG: 5-formyltetrahydrofolate cyclo-ligase [Phycisphaera sp.]|nr:5-formyltetrahydrofolate cyclo-ligase [Phycisphaera sp.]